MGDDTRRVHSEGVIRILMEVRAEHPALCWEPSPDRDVVCLKDAFHEGAHGWKVITVRSEDT